MRMEHQPKKYMMHNISYVFVIAILGVSSVVFIQPKIEYILWSIFLGNFIFWILAFKNFVHLIDIRYKFVHFKEMFYYGTLLEQAVI